MRVFKLYLFKISSNIEYFFVNQVREMNKNLDFVDFIAVHSTVLINKLT